MPFRRNTSPEALERARDLRKSMNKAERRLWCVLRRDGTGFRFRRQHPFGPYFLDFYCMEANLAVELDGVSHEGREGRDEKRDAFFASHGVETVRIANEWLDDIFDGYLRHIQSRRQERTGREGKEISW